ncbi:short transient receptor potential channel 2-like [Orbicella faveolata]|uniref:short transient receptor potential channel 2-like n=1 Tax=Orbicella faveolata TaxID=48498 RepID=UPI0009E59F00|nr:short transient receptor potential channel 2-like [Orbicella faveolata]
MPSYAITQNSDSEVLSSKHTCPGTLPLRKSAFPLLFVCWLVNFYLLRIFRIVCSDRWNILDLITLIIYFATFVLRMVTLAVSKSVTNNRSLVIAGYFYGLNTMFLTLRAFGHVMETTKQIGPIQIALFHILSDLVTIFWQFIAVILAFSIAITKVYVAEKSFISEENGEELVCSRSGIACWWKMVRHLCWSLMGAVDVDFLESADNPSVILVNFLYGAFLVMGVILLINMMIALLSNTYQKVQDNSLMEWSFKKAITIQTYSSCHPIPVPINLVSFMFKCCGWQKCFNRCRNGKQRTQTARKNSLEVVVKRLESIYFAEYGYLFPLTDERKLDRVLLETERNRQMANQIAQRTFTASHSSDKNVLPTGPQVVLRYVTTLSFGSCCTKYLLTNPLSLWFSHCWEYLRRNCCLLQQHSQAQHKNAKSSVAQNNTS